MDEIDNDHICDEEDNNILNWISDECEYSTDPLMLTGTNQLEIHQYKEQRLLLWSNVFISCSRYKNRMMGVSMLNIHKFKVMRHQSFFVWLSDSEHFNEKWVNKPLAGH